MLKHLTISRLPKRGSLTVLFHKLDQRYFHGLITAAGYQVICFDALPNHVYWFEGQSLPVDEAEIRAMVWHDAKIICISPLLDDADEQREVLLHEMIHADIIIRNNNQPLQANADPHGPRFLRWLRYLVREGEECMREARNWFAHSRQAREFTIAIDYNGEFRERLKEREGRRAAAASITHTG